MSDGAWKILVAEDNAAIANVIRFTLEHAGYSVILARNGRIAWDLLQEQTYDLLLTDHQMPEMDGCQLCKLLRQDERFDDMPVVMLTAKGWELERERLRRELQVYELLAKPFSPRDLTATVAQALLVECPLE